MAQTKFTNEQIPDVLAEKQVVLRTNTVASTATPTPLMHMMQIAGGLI